jgi:predicted transcriptional regulator
MEVTLSPELEDRLARLADERGSDSQSLAAEMVSEAVERMSGYDEWFLGEVEKGLTQIAAGKTVSHEAVELRLEAYFVGQSSGAGTQEPCA